MLAPHRRQSFLVPAFRCGLIFGAAFLEQRSADEQQNHDAHHGDDDDLQFEAHVFSNLTPPSQSNKSRRGDSGTSTGCPLTT